MSPADKCRAIAAELRERPEVWTQGEMARNSTLDVVEPRDESAVCWCALGLLERDFDSMLQVSKVIDAFGLSRHTAEWNDDEGRTALDVADLFDRAAAALESK